jgi:8-oxo-dGTP pyrophosphatase MutT (NUDIX family)
MQEFNTFIKGLSSKLNGSALPGLEAQLSMAPITRQEELSRMKRITNPKQSAVLVLFYPHHDETMLIFMKRPVDNTVHSGQVSFPGGRVEEIDRTFADTALREAQEEVNINPAEVTVIGSLSKLHIPPSNFDVYPIIGYTTQRPEFKGNYEVDKLLEVRLAKLMDPKTITTKTIQHRLGKLVDVPCYYVEGEIIWGATAMMLGELLTLVAEV